jgi:predicted phage terminase large subunit-like protein
MAWKLEEVALKHKKRLIINTPPRFSKTTFCSVSFPVWRIFKNPNLQILIITYGDDLSSEIGTQIRRLIIEYGPLFNVYLSKHTASKTKVTFVDRDGKEYRGKIEALGYKGAITGKTGDIIIIDDLIKGPEDALSPAYTRKIIDFYKSAIYTRLFEDSVIIVVSTRWSKNDLAGYLLENSSEDWDTYILPAVDDEGNSAWPERFSSTRMATIQKEEGAFWWSALYLQEPEELEGDVFEGEFLTIPRSEVDPERNFERVVRFWDRAATTTKENSDDPDWTVGLKMARINPRSALAKKYKIKYLVLNVVRFRDTPLKNRQKIQRTALRDGKSVEIFMEEEGGSSGKDTIDTYRREVLHGFRFQGIRSTGSKELRAMGVAASVEAQETAFIEDSTWNGNLFLEMRAFPYGSHDDQVDTLSGAHTRLRRKPAKVYI